MAETTTFLKIDNFSDFSGFCFVNIYAIIISKEKLFKNIFFARINIVSSGAILVNFSEMLGGNSLDSNRIHLLYFGEIIQTKGIYIQLDKGG